MFCSTLVSGHELDSEPAILADKMTRLLSEAEPPVKATHNQEVCHETRKLSLLINNDLQCYVTSSCKIILKAKVLCSLLA